VALRHHGVLLLPRPRRCPTPRTLRGSDDLTAGSSHRRAARLGRNRSGVRGPHSTCAQESDKEPLGECSLSAHRAGLESRSAGWSGEPV
jgi:hypothetical protein